MNDARPYEIGSVKLLTTFVGKVFPLSGRRIHTKNQNTGDSRQKTE